MPPGLLFFSVLMFTSAVLKASTDTDIHTERWHVFLLMPPNHCPAGSVGGIFYN